MSSQFYNRMKTNVADKLLNKYGNTIVLTDVNRNTLATYKGIKSPVRIENTPETVIARSTATVYITAGDDVAPQANQYIEMDGNSWIIIWVEPVRPTDVTILYTLFVANTIQAV